MRLKSLIKIFVVKESKIYMLEDKYIELIDDVDKLNKNYVKSLKINNIRLRQCYTFIKKEKISMDVTVMYVDIVNYNDIIGKYNILKLGDDIYTKKGIEFIKSILGQSSILKKIYPNEFSIPEVQKLFENTYNIKYDRRNFRKKLLVSKCVKELDIYSKYCKGRPAKMYEFIDNIDKEVV